MAPRKQPKAPPQAQDVCKLTAEDEIHVTSKGFLVNGTLRPNLDNCELGAGVTFIAQYSELVEDGAKKTAKRAPSKPVSAPKRAEDAVKVLGWTKDDENEAPSASEQSVHAPATKQHIQLPAELAELQELIDVYEDAQGAGPYVAIAVVGAYLWRKFQRQKQEQGQRCECATCRAHRAPQYAQHQAQHQAQHHAQHHAPQHQAQHQAPQEQRCLCPECVPPAPVAPSAPDVSASVTHAVPAHSVPQHNETMEG